MNSFPVESTNFVPETWMPGHFPVMGPESTGSVPPSSCAPAAPAPPLPPEPPPAPAASPPAPAWSPPALPPALSPAPAPDLSPPAPGFFEPPPPEFFEPPPPLFLVPPCPDGVSEPSVWPQASAAKPTRPTKAIWRNRIMSISSTKAARTLRATPALTLGGRLVSAGFALAKIRCSYR